MRICLVFPKSTFLEDPLVMPPLGLWYLAAQLEAQGHECDFFDMNEDELPSDGDYHQLWVSATSSQMYEVRKISDVVHPWTRTKTVLGGACVWANPETAGELHFDMCVGGEADNPGIVELVTWRVAEMPDNWSVARKRAEVIQPTITPGPLVWVRPPVRRWDTKYHFWLTDHSGAKHRTTTMFTSRGCPMACAFCESGRNGVIWDRLVRYEPVETVEAQVREIVERGHSGIMFYDDILPLNKPRTLGIMEVLKKYGIVWRCFLRTDVISKQGGYEYLKELAGAGLLEVLAGVESGDNRIKDNIHKGTTIEQDTQVLRWCKSLGIRFKASVILGLPGEDRDSMQRTRDWILTYRPDRVDVCTLIPFPGTPITRSHDYLGNEYDVTWEERLPEEFFYKGRRSDPTKALVHTSHLTAEEIQSFRNDLMQEIAAAGIPY